MSNKKEITLDNVVSALDSQNIKTRKALAEYFGVHRKYRPLLKILDQNNLLVSGKRDKYTISDIVNLLKKVAYELGKAPSIQEFDNCMRLWNKNITADYIRKYYFKNRWANILEKYITAYTVHKRKILTDDEILQNIRNFVHENSRVPTYDDFNKNSKYPHYDTVKNRFGNFTTAIQKADVSTSSPVRYGTIIVDAGNLYKSHKEYRIGKKLSELGIEFIQEPPYGIGKYKFDFFIPSFDIYIEYYGLYGKRKEYTETVGKKRKLYKGRNVLEIFPNDNIETVVQEMVETSTTSRKA